MDVHINKALICKTKEAFSLVRCYAVKSSLATLPAFESFYQRTCSFTCPRTIFDSTAVVLFFMPVSFPVTLACSSRASDAVTMLSGNSVDKCTLGLVFAIGLTTFICELSVFFD